MALCFSALYKNLPGNVYYTWLECHAPLDPVSLSDKMEEQAAEKQLCVIIMTEPKETLSELQDQLEPLCDPH